MSQQPDFVTVRDKDDSVWQSVVEKIAEREARKAAASAPGLASKTAASEVVADTERAVRSLPGRLEALVAAAHTQVFEQDQASQGQIPQSLSLASRAKQLLHGVGAAAEAMATQASTIGSAKRCASLALQIAKAKVTGNDERATVLQNAFDYNVCDVFWSQCIDEYVAFFKLGDGVIPYRAGLNNVLSTPLSATATIALFGDWGTGTDEARSLLQQIKGFQPDILMHLGDVYYSGTQEEMQSRFLDVCSAVFGTSMPTRFSLSGNHDMYSGGVGYYWLVDQLDQKASYFALQNDDWLFIAMDTGVHDYDPLRGGADASFLMTSEADWINNLVANKGNRKVVFLSHHPLFSAYDPIGGASVNTVLLNQLRASIPQVTAWFWGHEHRLGVYDPFQSLQRGRCLGHAAVPVFADATGDPPRLAGVPVHLENGKPLDMGTANGIFKHGFAIMTLNGASAQVRYYRQGEDNPLWEETV